MDAFLLALPEDQDLVLVPHSNAGLYAPAVAAERPVSAIVFVDASLPPLLAGVAPVVPAEFFEFLAARADGNEMLPPWTEWWEDEEVAALFPDGQTRNRVEREQTRLPLSYFRDSVLVPPGWDRCPCAYLAFGRTYEAQTTAARDLGWPVRVLPGEHLEMLVHPEVVAEAIVDLLQSATRREIGH
jgi:pimeloyl-ACP methyl ester carboxylesterase